MTSEDFQTQIKGREYNSHVFVDVFDDDGVWISVGSGAGSTRIIMTKEQAKDMIAALIRVVDHLEAK
jgi:ribosome-associated translation inhibitor RaiA